ncbi:hypothetical protein [Pseudomonas sp. Ps21-P2]|uniref:hypothetical protein n=1 Tax=Pseudomonas sp. Ps21-P2 TaxID=3080331 RepID=UPI00320A4189
MVDNGDACEVANDPGSAWTYLAGRGAQILVDTVDIYDGDTKVGTAPVVNGAWQFTASALVTGEHRFTARSNALNSNEWNLTVREALQLLAPKVVEVFMDSGTGFGNSLNLAKVTNSATVVVEYTYMQVGDSVTMNWNGAASSTSQTKLVESNVDLVFLVPRVYIDENIGMNVRVSYTVTPVGEISPVNSPVLLFQVTYDSLVGHPNFVEGYTTSYYTFSYSAGEIVVSNSLSNGTLLGTTANVAPTAVTQVRFDEPGSSLIVNQRGPQPWALSEIWPTNVEGIGFKFIYHTGAPGNPGPVILPVATYSNANTTNRIEFYKIGFVRSGTLLSGEWLKWTFGSTRLKYMGFTMTHDINIVVV